MRLNVKVEVGFLVLTLRLWLKLKLEVRVNGIVRLRARVWPRRLGVRAKTGRRD